jgi:hypothetical protein
MRRVIERAAFSLSTIDAALSLIDEVVGAPPWGMLWLRHLAAMDVTGEVTVDISNVVALTLSQRNAQTARSQGLPEVLLTPLRWWSWLVGGSLSTDADRTQMALEAYPPSEQTAVGLTEKTLTESMSALAQLGYRLPFAAALALSVNSSASRITVTRSTGRGGVLIVVELYAATDTSELNEVFSRLRESAGTRCAFATHWSDEAGCHYLEAFNDIAPSDNFAPPSAATSG